MLGILNFGEIKKARENLHGVIHYTPVKFSSTINQIVGNNLLFKAECFQKTGAFKFRGAYNKLFKNRKKLTQGVITASAGNHAQGIALAAKKLGLPSTVVMPEGAPLPKVAATQNYGSEVILEGDTYDDAFEKALVISEVENKTFIPAFDDYEIMAGQGTIALEVLEEVKNLDAFLVPVGGGGLISGIAVAVKEINPEIKIIGVQSEKTCSAVKQFKNEKENNKSSLFDNARSIADGIAVKNPGEKNMAIIKKYVDNMITVNEEEIAQGILLLMERSKMIVEGAGAVGVAAMLKKEKNLKLKDKNVVTVLSGGNIDVNIIARIIQRGLAKSGRTTRLHTVIKDEPGSLKKVLEIISETGANILAVNHIRQDPRLPLGMVGIDLDLETRDETHIEELILYLQEQGYTLYNR